MGFKYFPSTHSPAEFVSSWLQGSNLSVNVTAQSCALGSLHACGIPAARYLQR